MSTLENIHNNIKLMVSGNGDSLNLVQVASDFEWLLQNIEHSMAMAQVPGNDKVREIASTLAMTRIALGKDALTGKKI